MKPVKLAAADLNQLVLTVDGGDVVIQLKPEIAPNHVARIKTLTAEGFYDGVVFHRVIDGFMAQTGDPTGTGSGGSTYPDLNQEFSNESHLRGTVSMARTNDPNSANSQFFICFAKSDWLDGQYTVWGQVISGMEHIDALPKGVGQGGMVPNPGKIIKAQLR
ncbi:MAG: peptidylprolyl isomerase [Alphaproteobacteria bacterium]